MSKDGRFSWCAVAALVLLGGSGEMVLGLAAGGEIQPVQDLFDLLRGDQLPGSLIQSVLRLGLSHPGHSHRGGPVRSVTALEHRSPSLCPSGASNSLGYPVARQYETDEDPGKFPPAHLF